MGVVYGYIYNIRIASLTRYIIYYTPSCRAWLYSSYTYIYACIKVQHIIYYHVGGVPPRDQIRRRTAVYRVSISPSFTCVGPRQQHFSD